MSKIRIALLVAVGLAMPWCAGGASLLDKVRNASITVHWVGARDQFWFLHQTATGHEFLVVDAATGRLRPAFDHAAMADALHAVTNKPFDSNALAITDLDLSSQTNVAVTDSAATMFDCALRPAIHCKLVGPVSRARDFVLSPDGTQRVFLRDHNLWIKSEAGGAERQLTVDGVENFGYGDVDNYIDFSRVQRRRQGLPHPLQAVAWSPDGRQVIAFRQDLRAIPDRLFVTEYVAPDKDWSVEHHERITLAGDAKRPDSAGVVIDVASGKSQAIAIDPQALNDYALRYVANGDLVWWSRDDAKAFIITANRGGSHYGLEQIDTHTGAVRSLIEETAKFNVRLNPYDYARPNVYVTSDGREAIWYSERSGFGHLYLYDLERGRLKRAITGGSWVVSDLLHVDEHARQIYFTAVGREKGQNPYFRHLYRVGMDGGTPQLLTPEDADHDFSNEFPRGIVNGDKVVQPGSQVSPTGRYFIDSYSTTSKPAHVVLRRTDGKLIREIEVTDASALQSVGWSPPESVMAKAADGTTQLYGVMFKPRDFNPALRYPIVEVTYPGPQQRFAPTRYVDNFSSAGGVLSQLFADAKFIAVVIDGRGTAYRSREFRDAFLGTEDVLGSADHVAALRDLASSRPYMDLSRVGVIGASFGGYGSLRATLLNPDFFKVCVSAVGPGEWFGIQQSVSVERFFGVPSESAAARKFYDTASNLRLIERLGDDDKVMLIYGGVDENVPLREGFVVLNAFIKANKMFDFLIVPDASHGVLGVPYALQRAVRHFQTYLGGPR